ncbi:retrotransposon protein, putative, ty1-copia subclass [Tanacetum coccineum]
MVRSMMNLTTLPLSFWYYALETATRILNMVLTKKVNKTPYELWYIKVPNLSYLKVWGYEALVKRDMPDKLQQRYIKCIFVGYPKEMMGYYIYFPPENKIFVARYAGFLEKNLLSQEISGRAEELEEIQDEDTSPSKNTSKIPMKVEGTILDPEYDIWVDDMNAEMQSMKDNQVWLLLDLPPNSIRILIAIAAFYDYEIWKMDVKTAFLNGYLDEDIYMVQPKGFIDPNHPRKVGKLQRSIYGLKQASRSWNKRFDEEIKRNTKDMFLVYGGNPKADLRVDCYSNAGFETDRDDTKSQTGYVFVLIRGMVDWKSSKQSTNAMSAT